MLYKFSVACKALCLIFIALLACWVTQAQQVKGKPRVKTPVKLTPDQVKEMKKDADILFKDGDYRTALDEFIKLQNTEPENADFNYKLGVCYLNTSINKKAAAEFLNKASMTKGAPKDCFFYLGNALLYNEQFDDAVDSYEKYKEANNGKLNPKFNVDLHIEWAYHGRDLVKTPVKVKFENLGRSINSPTGDTHPVCSASDSVLFFTSARKGNSGGKIDLNGEFVSDIYFATKENGIFSKAKNAGISVNTEGNDEGVGLNQQGDRLLISCDNEFVSYDLFFSDLKGKSWNKTVSLGKTFTTKEKETGACFSPNGKTVYFAAELKGGKGGKDIWKSDWDEAKGTWGEPENLGDVINTKYDEDYPFLFWDGKTLFFASEGHFSMGGFDLFRSERPDPSQAWSKPENLGYPVNSVYDDKYFALTAAAKVGYISAIRDSGIGESDIYKLTFAEPLVSSKLILFKAFLIGSTGTPAKEGVCIITKKGTGEEVGTYNANASTGRFYCALAPGEYAIKIRGKNGKADEDFTITGDEKGDKIEKIFKLQ